jgi:hypothetical protein
MERVDYESLIISDLLGFYNNKSLDISPWYQRRSVWSTPQKAYLVNTILERKPVPSIYIRQQIDLESERTVKEVVDGQQRVRTIVSFRADEFPARHPNHRRKRFYSELTPAERTRFLSTPISVGYLIGATDQDVIEIFGRINSVSKTLNPQEKLNARYSGEFKQFCLRQAALRLPFWRATNLFSANEISRMIEVQFVSDLVINLIQGLSDYSPRVIEEYYHRFDEEFEGDDELSERLEVVFRKLVTLPPEAFSDTIFRSAQIVFSLIIVLDQPEFRDASVERIHAAIHEIDARVTADADLGARSEVERYLTGFASGNLHRIRTRAIRDEVIRNVLLAV